MSTTTADDGMRLSQATEIMEAGLLHGTMPSCSEEDVSEGLSRLRGHATSGRSNTGDAGSSESDGAREMGIDEMEEFDDDFHDRLWDLVYEVDCDAELYNLLVWAFPDPAGRVEPEHRLDAEEVRSAIRAIEATGIPELGRFAEFVSFWARRRFIVS